MVVEYGSNMPKSLYLGPRPRGRGVSWFLMINLDIKYANHQVCACPMLFVRVQKEDLYPLEPIGSTTPLFRHLKKFFKSLTAYDEKSNEMLIEGGKESSIDRVIAELHKLKNSLKSGSISSSA